MEVVHVLGFSTKAAVFYEQEFKELGETFVATVDGTFGAKGTVMDIINEQRFTFETLYTCGPTPMLKAIEEAFPHKKCFCPWKKEWAAESALALPVSAVRKPMQMIRAIRKSVPTGLFFESGR